jgi:phage terminase Nu1 subunit (DNA packaging protein)
MPDMKKSLEQPPAVESAPDLLDPTEAAHVAKVAVKTLAKWRCEGVGPPYFKVGGYLVRYDRRQLEQWIAKSAVVPGRAS